MAKKTGFDCREFCRYKDIIGFEGLKQHCKGPRIRLDESEPITKEGGEETVGELAKTACGSAISADKDIPSISMQEWADTTLPLPFLKDMHQGNRFN